jgi:hypothetical protein
LSIRRSASRTTCAGGEGGFEQEKSGENGEKNFSVASAASCSNQKTPSIYLRALRGFVVNPKV